MVCEKCEKKLGKVITPDPWKAGARNTTEGGGRVINENKALTAKKARFTPYGKFAECRICRQKVHQVGSNYCQGCAYKKGICAMCGKKILETKNYRQSSTWFWFLHEGTISRGSPLSAFVCLGEYTLLCHILYKLGFCEKIDLITCKTYVQCHPAMRFFVFVRLTWTTVS